MKEYLKLRKNVLDILNTDLPEDLYYHNIIHTLDVLNVINKYIKRLKLDSHNAKLLRIGAITHDIGFTVSRVNHEEKGRVIAKELMLKYGFSDKDIKVVEGLIMATKVPHSPKTEMEKIICDADLDYLGRKDFYVIGDQLFKELNASGLVSDINKWHAIQIDFLENHKYHTKFAQKFRQPEKEKRILELKRLDF